LRKRKIAVDIDSTLHHFWDQLERVARDRYGVALPYERQRTWGIEQLDAEQVMACIQETHSDANILAAEPYPGAVEAVGRWRAAGHWIHVTSHRAERCGPATERWLDRIGLVYDDLHLSFDKISRCVELEVDVLVDDSPPNILRAREEGMVAATILHPWNAELVADRHAIGGRSWPELEARLAPMLR
jgi:uncharacterized protein